MKLRFDLHIHTSRSYDGRDPPEAILRRAREAGLDGVAITDHNTTRGSREAQAKPDGLLVIPGVEVSTRGGHLLVLGAPEDIPRRLSPEETIERAHRAGALVIVPHPFHPLRHPIGAFEHLGADAIEVFNSRYLTGVGNRRARRRAGAAGLPMVAGSDAHIAGMVGRGVTEVEAGERSVEAVLEAIRRGRTRAGGHPTPRGATLHQLGRGYLRRPRGI
ncbi:MAG: PHP domain-containing protein [Euryarchaeota archaeon]|nr:PHP domain-containing protein [Euryarchaeota archaeon]